MELSSRLQRTVVECLCKATCTSYSSTAEVDTDRETRLAMLPMLLASMAAAPPADGEGIGRACTSEYQNSLHRLERTDWTQTLSIMRLNFSE